MRVHRVGICGTDISGYLGKMPFFSYPRIPGHELGVEVVEVGAGRDQRQARRPLLGRAVHQLPEHATPAAAATPTAARSTRRWASTATAACGRGSCVPARKLHVSRQARASSNWPWSRRWPSAATPSTASAPQADESCLIIGAGPIGLATLEFVKLTGAKIDRARHERAAARLLPAT